MGIFDIFVNWMADFLTICFNFTQMLGFPSYGIAIILMTIIIRLVLTPLTIKQVRSMKGMAKLQPRLKELQAKYKNDQKRMQEEMTKLYSEMGVNPLAGCVPLLVQMPFLFAIFYALKEYPYLHAYESFLWIPSLGDPDPLYILPVISALSTYLVSRQSSPTGDAAGQQKIIQVAMPLFIGYISISFPAGLVMYWAISNLFQYVQQAIVFRGEE